MFQKGRLNLEMYKFSYYYTDFMDEIPYPSRKYSGIDTAQGFRYLIVLIDFVSQTFFWIKGILNTPT